MDKQRFSQILGFNAPVVLVDLDDTLFQTARKMRDGDIRHVATLDVDGNPNGYMTNRQSELVNWLLRTAVVIPVTARSVEAYRRVRIYFTEGAVCSHGGVIVCPDGTIDASWHIRMQDTLAGWQERLHDLVAEILAIGATSNVPLRSWVVSENDLGLYVVAKHGGRDDSVLQAVAAKIRDAGLDEGMHVHGNGNNLAFLPQGLSKQHAVQELLSRMPEAKDAPLIGLGDSISDLGFMFGCDIWGTPASGQIGKAVLSMYGHERRDAGDYGR